MAAQAPSLPPDLGNRLASSDKTERDKALATATRFVKRLPNPPDTNTLLKLWKALYYTFWHSDKPLVQRDLAERLAALQASAPAAARGPFVAAFWATMMREWHSIDRIRLNKFYMLMEHVLEQQLQAMRAGRWADEALALYASVLAAGPLSPQSPRGLRYFLCDATLAAVAKVGLSIDDDGAASRVVLALADPYLTLLSAASADGPACERVADKVLRPLLCGKVPETDATPQPAVPALLGKRLLALAAEPSTRDSNRSFIYALQQEAEVAAAALGAAASGAAREPKKRASAEAKSSGKAQPKSSAKVVSALKGMLDKGVQKKTKVSEVTAPPPPPPPPAPPPPARGREVEKVDSCV